MSKEIRFWGKATKYFEFTNFYMRKIKMDSVIWPSSEHYYQALKFDKYPEIMDEIRLTYSPSSVYKLANVKYKSKIRNDWNEVKIDIMRKCVFEKFNQYEDLKNCYWTQMMQY